MALKSFWSKANGWIQNHKFLKSENFQVDNEGLLNPDQQINIPVDGIPRVKRKNNTVLVNPIKPMEKNQPIEKLQAGFEKLVENLNNINNNLTEQVNQNKGLMSHVERLPELLESFPDVVKNQKQLTENLLEQLRANAAKNQQFVETVEKIPVETAKQSDTLEEINHQLAASADSDVQMNESFVRFNETLEHLDQKTATQNDSIIQMSKTFATSDRHLKYVISKQNKRFMWMFVTLVTVSIVAISVLTCIIIYLKQ